MGQIGSDKKVNDFFIHSLASAGFNAIAEAVTHDLTLQEAKAFMKLHGIYNYGGVEALVKVQK